MRQAAPDLLLLDMIMPRLNGHEVLKRIKADTQLRQLPVIMISAIDQIEHVADCIERGAEDYLAKPFNSVLLKARVGAALEKKRLRDAEQVYLRQIEEERLRSDRLILNVLPPPIADRLKGGETGIVNSYDEVAVFFADIVGFTDLTEQLPGRARLSACWTRYSPHSTRSPIDMGSRRSRRSATLPWRLRDSRSPRRPCRRSRSHGVADARGHQHLRQLGHAQNEDQTLLRLRDRRRHRSKAVHLRPVGRYGQHGEPHGVRTAPPAEPTCLRPPTNGSAIASASKSGASSRSKERGR